MKKSILISFTLLFCLFFLSCRETNSSDASLPVLQDSKEENIHEGQDLITLNIKSEIRNDYKDIKALKDNSQIVVKGIIVKSHSYMKGPGLVTEYTLKTSKIYKGNITPGDAVIIISSGGTVPFLEYSKFNGAEKDILEKKYSKERLEKSNIQLIFNGRPLPQKGEEYIFFASQTDDFSKNEIYRAINALSGHLHIKNGKAHNFAIGYEESIEKVENILD